MSLGKSAPKFSRFIGLPMRFPFMAVATFSLFAWTSAADAQEAGVAANLQREVAVVHAEVLALAEGLRIGLKALVPSSSGWICQAEDRLGDAPALDLLPNVQLSCTHGEQSLDLTLMLDQSSTRVFCQQFDNKRQGIADGRIKPDLFRFFEGGDWRLVRSSVDLRGCAADLLALSAIGNRSEEAIAEGPASIDAFAEALLSSDLGPLKEAARASDYAAALERLMSLLDAQSRLLAAFMPAAPAGEARQVLMPSSGVELGLPSPMILWAAPSATADLEVQGCRLLIEISASTFAIHEAATTGLSWARPGEKDGAVSGAFIRRNTARFVGHESMNGTGIEALVDGAVLVRVVIPGSHPCESDPEIVSRLFEEILENDLRPFAAP